MARHAPAAFLAAATLAAGAAGCGGGDGTTVSVPDTGARTAPPATTIPREVASADEQAIREWADTLRRGDVDGAAAAFAPGSLVANGGQPLRLDDRAAARAFNSSLPCGAVVTEVEPSAHGFVIATFRLTERPGPGECGDGAGSTARVALRIDDGLIRDWIRLRDTPAPSEDEAPGTAA
jgi:hypothetical protein